jgi:KUP system potassium uptake protein
LVWRVLFGATFLTIEGIFLYANMFKFMEGGVLTVTIAGIFALTMYIWYKGRHIKNRYIQFQKIKDYQDIITDIKNDDTIPKYATNLVFLSKADYSTDIENKILYSIINKHPKRADHYWILHSHIVDDPYTNEYSFEEIIPNTLFRLEFRMGFRTQPLLNLYFRKAISDLSANNEISLESTYPSLNKHHIMGDFKFIVIHRVHNYEHGFVLKDKLIMNYYNFVARLGITDIKAFGLDTSNVQMEQVPLIINQEYKHQITRFFPSDESMQEVYEGKNLHSSKKH